MSSKKKCLKIEEINKYKNKTFTSNIVGVLFLFDYLRLY